MNPSKLHPRDARGRLHVVVESPRGSSVKLRHDPELDAFTLARQLSLGVTYPFDWGFVPGTRAPDGDPLDAMVLLDAPTWPGVVHVCEPIGVVRVSQVRDEGRGRERNDRVIAVPVKAPRLDGIRDARDLPDRTREEIEQFFRIAVIMEDKEVALEGFDGRDAAEALIGEAIAAFRAKSGRRAA
jgi:inorganic pyrophosphatase